MAYSSSSAVETQFSEEEVFLWALNISSSHLFAMSLRSVIELGLLEIIAKAGRGLSAVEIAAQLPTKNPKAPNMLEQMLRLLAAYSILNCTVITVSNDSDSQRLYELTPIAKYLVLNEDGVSVAHGELMLKHKALQDSWDKLTEAILEGGDPFILANGIGPFELASRDPTFNKEMNASLANTSILTMKRIMQVYKGFENINQLVDVGGGVGNNLKIIISKYPHIKGINYDLPHVIQHANPSPGVELISGDMFQSVPRGEVIWLKWVLHTLDDDRCIKLLKNCYKALPDNGKIIVTEIVVPEELDTTSYAQYICLWNVVELTLDSTAKERTLKEFWSLANASGFTTIKLACRAYLYHVMEFYK